MTNVIMRVVDTLFSIEFIEPTTPRREVANDLAHGVVWTLTTLTLAQGLVSFVQYLTP